MVIDCVGWRDEWKEAYRRGVLKSAWNGGRYISVASTDDPQIHSVWQVRFPLCYSRRYGRCCCSCSSLSDPEALVRRVTRIMTLALDDLIHGMSTLR